MRDGLRRLERAAARALVALTVLYLVGYTAAAFVLQSHVNHLLAQQLGLPRAFTMGASVAPLGLALKAGDTSFTTKTNETGSAAATRIVLPLFMPWRAETRMETATYANRYVRLTLDSFAASTPLFARRVAAYHSEAKGVSLWPAAAPDQSVRSALAADSLTIDFQQRLQAHDAAAPEADATVELEKIVLPQGPNETKPLAFDRLTLRTTAEPALPRDLTDTAAVTAWRDAGGRVNIAPFELEGFGTTSTLSGPVGLDDKLVPNGTLKLTFTGLDQAYKNLRGYNLLPPQQYEALGALLQLLPQKGAAPFDFPVAVRDHAVFFMDGAIYEFNRLPWEAAPADVPAAQPDAPKLPLTPADPVLPLGDKK